MRNRERHSTQSTVNPDIASTTHELKALHARTAVTPPEANKDKTRRLGHAPIVGTLALAITLGVGAFIGTRGGESQPTPERTEPTQSAPATPGEVNEADVAEFGISALEVDNDPALFAEAYYGEINEFINYGVDEDVASSDRRLVMDDEDYIAEISENINADFVNNMFVPEWQNDAILSEYVQSLLDVAASTRLVRLKTYAKNMDEIKEPYERGFIVDSAVHTDNGGTSYRILGHGYDNRDLNNAAEWLGGNVPNTEKLDGVFDTKIVDGKVLISGVSY